MEEVRIEVGRGALVESWHQVSAAVVGRTGLLVGCAGQVELPVIARSAVKPFQALPLVEDGALAALGITDEELAVCCGSHGGESFHVAAVRSLLGRAGAGEEMLACGPQLPMNEAEAATLAARGEPPRRIYNNCSGKHAGMLALARLHGWDLAGYHRLEHPVQQRMVQEIARWTGLAVAAIPTAVDGCGVPTFAVPLVHLAGAFARLVQRADAGEPGAARVVSSMAANPAQVGGTGRLCTDLGLATRGRIIAKVGAEGVYCAGIVGAGTGIALKVHDGAWRAAGPALIGVLKALGLLADAELRELRHHAAPAVVNTRGEEVGAVRADVALEPPGE